MDQPTPELAGLHGTWERLAGAQAPESVLDHDRLEQKAPELMYVLTMTGCSKGPWTDPTEAGVMPAHEEWRPTASSADPGVQLANPDRSSERSRDAFDVNEASLALPTA